MNSSEPRNFLKQVSLVGQLVGLYNFGFLKSICVQVAIMDAAGLCAMETTCKALAIMIELDGPKVLEEKNMARETARMASEDRPSIIRNPRRQTAPFDRDYDNFLMDFENACVEEYGRAPPRGRRRFDDEVWAQYMKRQMYPNSDLDWEEYMEWVSAGGGDSWTQ